jgi:hypothetical protein
MPSRQSAFLFDLDGTLVLAWREALDAEGIGLSVSGVCIARSG